MKNKILLLSALTIMTSSCQEDNTNTSKLNNVLNQPVVDSSAFIVKFDNLNQDQQVFQWQDSSGAAADEPERTSPFSHLPSYISNLSATIADETVLKGYECQTLYLEADPSKCLEADTSWAIESPYLAPTPSYTQEFLKALKYLTYADMVPACYQEQRIKTNQFEMALSRFKTNQMNLYLFLNQEPYEECAASLRSTWSTSSNAFCNNIYNRFYYNMEQTFTAAYNNDIDIQLAYDLRYKLALRLGVDELKPYRTYERSDGSVVNFDITESIEVPAFQSISLEQYQSNHQCPEGKIGDDECLLGAHFTNYFRDNTHVATSFSTETQELINLATDLSGQNRDYSNLIWDAVRMVLITQGQVDLLIQDHESETQPDCTKVANYTLGDYTERHSYIPTYSSIEAYSSYGWNSGATYALDQEDVKLEIELNGDNLVFYGGESINLSAASFNYSSAAINGVLVARNMLQYRGLFDKVRVRLFFADPFYPESIVFKVQELPETGFPVTAMNFLNLDLFNQLTSNATNYWALYLEGCDSEISCQDDEGPDWNLLSSFNLYLNP